MDLIDREQLMNYIRSKKINIGKLAHDVIMKQPSIQPQESKTGHWFVDERPESDREIICSNCEQPIFRYHKLDFDYRPKYCPNCGAKMESEEKHDTDK